MNTNVDRQSAKIYQFPVKARLTAGSLREKAKPANDLAEALNAQVVCTDSWYHDAAVKEAVGAGKR